MSFINSLDIPTSLSLKNIKISDKKSKDSTNKINLPVKEKVIHKL